MKEKSGGKINLFVVEYQYADGSRKKVTKMNINDEQREYDKFCLEFTNKVREIREDYEKMTPNNQAKFRNAAENIVCASGIEGLLRSFKG